MIKSLLSIQKCKKPLKLLMGGYNMWNENLKLLRIKKNLTQKDVAALLGINQASYGRYEIGDIEPKISSIIYLADYYNVTTDYIFGRTKYSIKANKELKQLLSKIQTDLEDIKKML